MIGSPETLKTVGSPNDSYESMVDVWKRNRAIIGGERKAKEHDTGPNIGANLLIPFSPSMSREQYNFFKAEAELPGVCAQYSRILVGGLLRKQPTLTLPAGVPTDAADWILNGFGQDGSTLTSVAMALKASVFRKEPRALSLVESSSRSVIRRVRKVFAISVAFVIVVVS